MKQGQSAPTVLQSGPSQRKIPSGQVSQAVPKRYKIFFINCHSESLHEFQTFLQKVFQLGPCKKISVVPLKGTEEPGQIAKAIEMVRKQIEFAWKSVKGDLEADIWLQWMTSVEEAKMRYNEGHNKPPEKRNMSRVSAEAAAALPASAESSGSFEGELEEEMEEEEPPVPPVIRGIIKNSDMKYFVNELRNRESSVSDYYILLFCKSPTPVLKDLLALNLEISAVIHFIPCPESELEEKVPTLYNDLEAFRQSPETKHVGLFIATPTIESLPYTDPVDLYDQARKYIFDIEMLSQHFLIYQSEFIEINDELESYDTMFVATPMHSSKNLSDNTAVSVFFDQLCRTVESRTMRGRRYSQFHPRPFLDNDYGKIIIEDTNDMLKSAIAAEMNLVSYWKAAEHVINAIRQSLPTTPCLDEDINLPVHQEFLSWESFAQHMLVHLEVYDHSCRIDLSDKVKLYVLRRTFHQILENTRKFELTTRLCLRDFYQFIAPTYVSVLRKRSEVRAVEEQEPDQDDNDHTSDSPSTVSVESAGGAEKMFFSGLTFDDTFQELTVVERTYRFHRKGLIRATVETWRNMDPKLTVEIRLFKCLIFAHRWDKNRPQLFPRVRIITQHGITCNVVMSDNPLTSSVVIHWPNDCQIRYYSQNGYGAVEQLYCSGNTEEYKRVYTDRGSVLIYLRNGNIDVLTPNGIKYKLYPSNYTDGDSDDEPQAIEGANIIFVLGFIEYLKNYGIACKCFDVTTNDGRKLRVRNGVAVEQRAHYLLYEWMDLGFGQMFGDRDDGVKLISSYWGLKTYYPSGIMIHTTVDEEYIEMEFDCRSQSTENILRKINPDIIQWMDERRIHREVWVCLNCTYEIQDVSFASVTCSADHMTIKCPDQLEVTVNSDALSIDIGIEVSMRFAPDQCNISSAYDNDMGIKLNLLESEDEILAFNSSITRVVLKEDGRMTDDISSTTVTPFDERRYFATKQYKFCIAFMPEYEYDRLIRKYSNTKYFYKTPKKMVILKNILNINDRFSMPIADLDELLDEMYITKCARPKLRDRGTPDDVYAARTVINLRTLPEELCDSLRSYFYIEITLSDNIQEALDFWFGEKTRKYKYSPAWKRKIRTTSALIGINKERVPIYSAMIQHKVFPKYHEFVKAKSDIDKLDIRSLLPILQKKGFKGGSNLKHN